MQIDQQQESLWRGKRGSDGHLARRALEGDEKAFEALVQRYSGPLFSFICHFLGDYDQACDILQQVLLQLYLSLPGLHLGVPLKPWLFQVARNRCLDELRRKRAVTFSELESGGEEGEELPVAVESIADGRPLPEELAERHDLQRLLLEAIHSLPPRFRAVVLLRYTAQLSFAEIGQALSMPEATAKTYFQRSKPLLRASLSGQVRAGTPS
ncbi:RNA polymerase sigma factor [Thermogemmatispora onikobensis]|uniref:RNA polymerase sigma factor n=1 Tax=Thermogemmatispora onikobensis TaxID=732234 RepID=UPI000852B5AC|nr:sigma-70 family RNA polymerase sigma factor [Thermogemmatispora onikobensis]